MDRRTFLHLPALPLAVGMPGAAGATVPNAKKRPRPRDAGIRIGRGVPGRFNAITDVAGVRVGHVTLMNGEGALHVGHGPVRTGVTAIWPHDSIMTEYLPCGVDAPNGNGELTGMLQAKQLGVIASPICLTNTSSVGMVYDALIERTAEHGQEIVPVVGETWDAFLNDIEGRHVHASHVFEALDKAEGGHVEEGNVGGGTGMISYGFKGGIGTASRVIAARGWTVGALVQANHGERSQLRIDGVPIGEAIADLRPQPDEVSLFNSIIMVLATDAPLLSHQLGRLARRAVHGLARTGSISNNSSGDFALAFSTANRISAGAFRSGAGYTLRSIEQYDIQPLFAAAAEAVEEAVINALFAATDMRGRDDHFVSALPVDRTLELMRRHGRLFDRNDVDRRHAGF